MKVIIITAALQKKVLVKAQPSLRNANGHFYVSSRLCLKCTNFLVVLSGISLCFSGSFLHKMS